MDNSSKLKRCFRIFGSFKTKTCFWNVLTNWGLSYEFFRPLNTKIIFVKKYLSLNKNVCVQIKALLMGFRLKKKFRPPNSQTGYIYYFESYCILAKIAYLALKPLLNHFILFHFIFKF